MKLLTCILTQNACYKTGQTIKPQGVMVHSTGANNPTLRRYVQPSDNDPDRAELLELLGVNRNGNDWNHTAREVCVHGFIGKLADGTVAAVQTLPWDCRGWHAGSGKKGSANNTHISFEICEDGLGDRDYFEQVYRAAVELTAHLCRLYALDPLRDGVVICHSEGHSRGIASGHADVTHWFPKFGKSMDDFRADVAAEMAREEDNDMTQEKFNELMTNWLAAQAELPPAQWSAEERAWMEEMGLLRGDGRGNMAWQSFVTREQLAAVLHRYASLTK